MVTLKCQHVLVARELDAKSEKLRERLRQAAGHYQNALVGANATQQQRAEIIWQGAKSRLADDAERLNRAITAYNLKIPPGIPHKPHFLLQREIQRALE
ncbi:MAG TPA: hypothetical protein VHO69_06885 [Phototrophicaceae bacterium]|nr:hypothetical protein [Phototrophicaceae bacterium]